MVKKVEHILEKYPKSRDSDQWLTIKIWAVDFPQRIHGEGKDKFVYLRDIMELPREDIVKRIRAHIQNDQGKFLPTTWEVAKQRRINEGLWRAYMKALKDSEGKLPLGI